MSVETNDANNVRWDRLLQPGERILWEGSPLPGIRNIPFRVLASLFGLGLLAWGLAILMKFLPEAVREGNVGQAGFAFVMGSMLTLAGVSGALLQWRAAARAHTTTLYVLTNRCAYIVEKTRIGTVKSYPILPETAVELKRHKGYDDVWFHVRREPGSEGSVTTTQIGFEGISEGQRVFALIRNIQTEQAT